MEQDVQRPTGGLYSSSSDLSRYLRYILTHYNALTPTLNWLQPASYSGTNSFFGMPWEIFRTSKILFFTKRPVTFVTKSGGLPGYTTIIIMAPDYDIGVTILTAGNGQLLEKLRELVTVPLIRGVEELAFMQMHDKYAGTYIATDFSLNSSITLTVTPSSGLTLTRFISNDTDVLASPLVPTADPDAASHPWHAQLVPTLLYRNQTALNGALFRLLVVPERWEGETEVWDDFCITDDDPAMYAGLALNEVAFWTDEDGAVVEAELPAWRLTLKRALKAEEREAFVLQG